MLRDFCTILFLIGWYMNLFLTAICLRHVIYLMEDLAKLYQQGTSQILTLWITLGLLIKISTTCVSLFTKSFEEVRDGGFLMDSNRVWSVCSGGSGLLYADVPKCR